MSTEKRIQTTLERYGVENVSQLPKIQDKRRATFESKRDTILVYQEPRVNDIHASDLSLLSLNIDFVNEWLSKYHPLGAPKGTVLALGLCDESTLYCVMTFKRPRNKKYYSELSRMWTLPTYNVIDGYQLLSQYASEFGIWNIVAYVNPSFENVRDYESIGMKHVRTSQRTRWWVRDSKLISDASRRQKKLTKQYMEANGFTPMYDLGVFVFEFVE